MKEHTKQVLIGISIVFGAIVCFWLVPMYWEYQCSIRGKIYQEANPRYCGTTIFSQHRSEK